MNKYQWMRKQRRYRRSNFKSFLIFVVVIVLSFVILKGCQSIAEDFWDKIKEKSLSSAADIAVRTFTINNFYEDYDCETTDYGTASIVMRDFFPVGDMYMKQYVELPSDTESPDYMIVESETEPESTETATQTTKEIPDETVAETQSETQSETNEIHSAESEIMAAAAEVYSLDKLMDYKYVLDNFYVVPSVTSLRPQVLDLEKITSVDLTIEKDSSVPQILIFHTHSQERFADSEQNGKSIVDVGDYLTELLRDKYGYNVIHLTDTFDMAGGVLDRSEAYTYANAKLDEVLAENPTIQVVIDLHRDGVDASTHLVTTINGKQTAKVMLFNGVSYTKEQGDIDYLYNPYLTENLAMTYKMYLLGATTYPDFFRCIYISGYRYCLYHVPRSMLIEAGAQTNTFEEVYNAMEPLAELLNKELTVN